MKKSIACTLALATLGLITLAQAQNTPTPTVPAPPMTLLKMDLATQKQWLAAWAKDISGESKGYRTCDKAMGEDIAWTVAPMMNGFYWGYMATHDAKYADMLVDWTDSMIKRAVKEPDGYYGWPSKEAAGTPVDNLDSYNADSMLSDAMFLAPVVRMAKEMTTDPALKEKYGEKGQSYLKFAEAAYEKWIKRGGWRDTEGEGMISVVLPYGMDPTNTTWIGYDTRNDPGHGFSHPDNKANLVASWMLAMWDATGKPEYKDHAEKWFKLMRSRMTLKADGTFDIWNYWQPAGPWDYKPGGKAAKLWIGVHPKAGYYQSDTGDIINAYQHGIVFTKDDIDHLIDTAKTTWCNGEQDSPAPGMLASIASANGTAKMINACFPNSKTQQPASAGPGAILGKVVSVEWNPKTNAGKIVMQPGDAAPVSMAMDKNTKVQVLRLWTSLVPYDVEIQKNFEATFQPDSWSGIGGTPHFIALQNKLAEK